MLDKILKTNKSERQKKIFCYEYLFFFKKIHQCNITPLRFIKYDHLLLILQYKKYKEYNFLRY